MDKETQK